MSLKIKGTVKHRMQKESGQGRNGGWEKISFVIETGGEYPKTICFDAWGKTVQYAEALTQGQQVEVSFEPESREYNGRWYTNLRAYRIDAAQTGSAPQPTQQPTQPPTQQQPEPLPSDGAPIGTVGDDDLPF